MVNFSKERDRDLFDAYRRKKRELGDHARYMTRRAIVQLTVDSPAKKFYVTPETALKMISSIDKHGHPCKSKGVTAAKFAEIHKRYKALKAAHPLISKYALADEVVNSPAPRFYIEWEAALTIIYEMEKTT